MGRDADAGIAKEKLVRAWSRRKPDRDQSAVDICHPAERILEQIEEHMDHQHVRAFEREVIDEIREHPLLLRSAKWIAVERGLHTLPDGALCNLLGMPAGEPRVREQHVD